MIPHGKTKPAQSPEMRRAIANWRGERELPVHPLNDPELRWIVRLLGLDRRP